MSTVIQVENLTKEYRLVTINHGTLYRDLQSWWARLRGQEDPNSLVGHHAPSLKSNSPFTHSTSLKEGYCMDEYIELFHPEDSNA